MLLIVDSCRSLVCIWVFWLFSRLVLDRVLTTFFLVSKLRFGGAISSSGFFVVVWLLLWMSLSSSGSVSMLDASVSNSLLMCSLCGCSVTDLFFSRCAFSWMLKAYWTSFCVVFVASFECIDWFFSEYLSLVSALKLIRTFRCDDERSYWC